MSIDTGLFHGTFCFHLKKSVIYQDIPRASSSVLQTAAESEAVDAAVGVVVAVVVDSILLVKHRMCA